jgi:alkyl sulfatase BDS1-like metallo-beta-lactamase superfamily hydrolase
MSVPHTSGLNVCVLPDLDETWTVTLGHGTLRHRKGADSNPEARLTIKRSDLGQVILGSKPLTEQLKGGQARIEADVKVLHDLIERLDNFEFWFDIVTP